MINNIFFIIILIFGLNNFAHSEDLDCGDFKKFSVNYMKCKANLVKNKTISVSKDFVEDTKDYQSKEWSREKK